MPNPEVLLPAIVLDPPAEPWRAGGRPACAKASACQALAGRSAKASGQVASLRMALRNF